MSATGPFLYDDDPAPLHTGTPRRRQGLLVAALAGTVLLAVGMVVALFAVKGSPGEQAEEVVGVFLAALSADDTETAHQLLCERERERVGQDDVAAEYLGTTPGEVVGSSDAGVEQAVEVRWADGATSWLAVISEDGARVCGPADG